MVDIIEADESKEFEEANHSPNNQYPALTIRRLTPDEWERFQKGEAVVEMYRNGNRGVKRHLICGSTEVYEEVRDGDYDCDQTPLTTNPQFSTRWYQFGVGLERGADPSGTEDEIEVDEYDPYADERREAAEALFEMFQNTSGGARADALEALHCLDYRVEKEHTLKEGKDN